MTSDVPLDVYGEGPLESALQDMQWVSDVAVSHEAVVEHFARQRGATVVPMKLFTMFSTRERALAEMRSRRREIDNAIKRVAGCEEWGVRVGRAAAVAQRSKASAARTASGAAFLAAKKQARDDARDAVLAVAEAAESVFDALSAVARDARRRTDAPAGADAPPLLDAAFLVLSTRRTTFKAAARKAAADCARAGGSMTLTGPWPAYNFVQPAEAAR